MSIEGHRSSYCRTVGPEVGVRQFRVHLGEYFEALGPWDHYATLTFASDVTADAARREFTRWIERLTRAGHGRLSWVWVLERGAGLGRVHLHALIGGAAPIGAERMKKCWYAGSDVKIMPYIPGGGAAAYLAKQVARPWFDWDVSPLPRRRSRGKNRHGRPARVNTGIDLHTFTGQDCTLWAGGWGRAVRSRQPPFRVSGIALGCQPGPVGAPCRARDGARRGGASGSCCRGC